ncbi:MAG: dienelactone hydrolase family protein [Hyphomicrobiales bacterium]|nr:dienelactone hydrolase family protein [Hyphomicrobiales bacterium]
MNAEALDVERQETHFQCPDGFHMRALVLAPKTGADLPGLLFVAEPFGLNNEIQRVAREIASNGYVVMLPDLMSRGPWFSCVRALMGDLRRERGRGVDDLLAARVWLAGQRGVDPSRMAVIGLCMGGGFALILSKTGLFQVAAPFYGQTPHSLDGACPIVASYGARDRIVREHAEHLRQEVERLDIPHDIKTYEGAGHSFMTRAPNRLMAVIGPLTPARAGYEPNAASDATRRVVKFLRQHLVLK